MAAIASFFAISSCLCFQPCELLIENPSLNPKELERLANLGIDLAFDFPARSKKENNDCLFFSDFEKRLDVWLELCKLKPSNETHLQ